MVSIWVTVLILARVKALAKTSIDSPAGNMIFEGTCSQEKFFVA